MAREIGGIEVVLSLDDKDFTKGVKDADKQLETIEKTTKDTTKTLGKLEDQQEKLLDDLKATEIGSKEYNRLRRELAQTSSEVRNLELGFEGLDQEQRASEIKSVVGGLGDMATAAAAVSASLGGADLEQYVKQVETVERVAIGATGAMESYASINKLIQSQNTLTAESFKNLGKAVGATTLKITAIVGGVAALGIALKSIYDISKPLQDAIQSLFDGFSKSVQYIKIQFIEFINSVIEGFNSIADTIGFDKIEKSANDFLKGAGKDVSEFFKDIGGDDFATAFKNNFDSILNLIKEGYATVDEFWDRLNNPKNYGFDDSGLKDTFESIDTSGFFDGLDQELKGLEIADKILSDDVANKVNANLQKIDLKNLQDEQKKFNDIANATNQAASQVGNSLVSMWGQAESGAEAFAQSLAKVAVNVISAMLGQSIAAAITSATTLGIPTGGIATPAFIASQVGTVLSAFAAIPSFASGGAYRHSEAGQSEIITPPNKVPELMDKIGGDSDRLIVVEIDGEPILTATERASNKRGRVRAIKSRY